MGKNFIKTIPIAIQEVKYIRNPSIDFLKNLCLPYHKPKYFANMSPKIRKTNTVNAISLLNNKKKHRIAQTFYKSLNAQLPV